ncbi:ribonuclease P protein component [Enterobacteriaceae endosymbiont of Donacia thalassina]|uniref:ribonuclease P protein component n=1 Tax=Enterobacteriaceae endosymbiont of Donacia thalassina TaxID=2675786 RepID=UPI0014492377|nr:ribonuclease P protein component [Enterobacteriaceae endosymbiont of Donacia thalassina]QJC37518.1 ribonuclease P protein component [Enterobacteriaceae endosymbiont of Donacia thalassina]
MNNFNFSKKKRLTSLNFNLVFNNPIKLYNKYYTILSKKNRIKYSRIGIIIPKKIINKTNIRNKLKRIIREYFRLNQYLFVNMDYIIFVNNKNILKKNNFCLKKYLEKIWNFFKKKQVILK